MECDCKDWKENIEIVNGPLLLQLARNPQLKGYIGKIFKYCPWCSLELKWDSGNYGLGQHDETTKQEN